MGIELISVTERLESTPEGKLMLIIIAGMNEFYSDNLSQEVMKGLKENAYQCKFTGGTPPLGYKVDPESRKLVIDENEAMIVRLIFQRYASGYGYNSIINELTSLGYHTKSGKLFGKNSLYELLRNEKYIGVYTYNRAAKRKKTEQETTIPIKTLLILSAFPAAALPLWTRKHGIASRK